MVGVGGGGGGGGGEAGSRNLVSWYEAFQRGAVCGRQLRKRTEHLVSGRLANYDVYTTCSCMTRRVTAIAWSPGDGRSLVMGSKGGEIVLCNPKEKAVKRRTVDEGIGPGGSILSIAFDPASPANFYTASLDGTVKCWHVELGAEKVLFNTGTFDRWFCSVNVSAHNGLVLTGDTNGYLTLVSGRDKAEVAKHRLHTKKITTAETCARNGWLLVTASIDKTVKVWDVRMLRDNSPLKTLPHDKPVNSAVLSATDGGRLLTTDQHSQLRVYRTADWSLETLIVHPHRHFQHLTAIKASWHPLCDLIVVGRYPDPALPTHVPDEPRTVDVFSCRTGRLMAQLSTPMCKGIMSLNVFDPTGEFLASSMGLFVPVWVYRQPLADDEPRDARQTDSGYRGPPLKKLNNGEAKKFKTPVKEV